MRCSDATATSLTRACIIAYWQSLACPALRIVSSRAQRYSRTALRQLAHSSVLPPPWRPPCLINSCDVQAGVPAATAKRQQALLASLAALCSIYLLCSRSGSLPSSFTGPEAEGNAEDDLPDRCGCVGLGAASCVVQQTCARSGRSKQVCSKALLRHALRMQGKLQQIKCLHAACLAGALHQTKAWAAAAKRGPLHPRKAVLPVCAAHTRQGCVDTLGACAQCLADLCVAYCCPSLLLSSQL